MPYLIRIYILYFCTDTAYDYPVSVVQAQDLDAEFLCQLPEVDGTIEWLINETLFRYVSNEGLIRIEGRPNSTEALIL